MPYFDDIDASLVEGRIEILNRLYASEIVAAEQYWNHEVAFRGPNSLSVQAMLDEHANEEMGHAELLRNRIAHLRGKLTNSLADMPILNPAAETGEGDIQISSSPNIMLQQDLQGELIAIQAYTEAIAMMRDYDPGTVLILTQILNDEFEHQHDLDNLLS